MDSSPERMTIMIVDDTPANLVILDEMLQGKGYRVLAFPSGKMALKAAMNNPPDLILLDILMPDMNGYDVCKRLKAEDTLKQIPVLFISALNEAEDKVKAFSSGGVDYVAKPFQLEEVLARVETHLHIRQMQMELEKYTLHLENLVKEKVAEISNSQLAAIVALAKLAEFRDDDTGAHIERTQAFCKILAEELRNNQHYAEYITDVRVSNISHAAPLHDIGKVGISDNILLKPGRHTPEESEIMKTHTIIGAKALSSARSKYPNNAFLNTGIVMARSHHEKWDGSGYPDGLSGEDIPLSARIMAVADVYDALRSKRPYKSGFTHEKSCAIILEGAGIHFDPALIVAFKAVELRFADTYEKMQDNK